MKKQSDKKTDTEIVKRKPGRPQKFTKQELLTIKDELKAYIDSVDDPTVVGFIAQAEWSLNKEYMSNRPEFSDLTKRALAKQEAFLLNQHKNPTMAIFRLKQPQFGYTDKRELETKNLNLDMQASPELNKSFSDFLKQQTQQG